MTLLLCLPFQIFFLVLLVEGHGQLCQMLHSGLVLLLLLLVGSQCSMFTSHVSLVL